MANSRLITNVIVGAVTPNTNVTAPLGTYYSWEPTTTTSEVWFKATQTAPGVPDNTGWIQLGVGGSGTITTDGASAFGDGSGGSPVNTYQGVYVISAALGATVNNWVPAGYAGETIFRVTTTTVGGTTFNGLDLGAFQLPGRIVRIQQNGANALTFAHENAGSTDVNRFWTRALVLVQFQTASFQYAELTSGAGNFRWVLIGS